MQEPKQTTITLLSQTQNPIETIYVEWRQSREDGPVPTPAQVSEALKAEEVFDPATDEIADYVQGPKGSLLPHDFGKRNYTGEVREVFEKVVSMKIPVAETIDFVFLIEHCSIALREQLVRHRIGHKHGGQMGADIIPDLADSTFWAQTMRVKDMGRFFQEGEYLLPESAGQGERKFNPNCDLCGGEGAYKDLLSVTGAGTVKCDCWTENTPHVRDSHGYHTLKEFYQNQMRWVESAYNKLVKAGMPKEDARNLLPLGCGHRLVWKLNLSSLMHVLGKRSCWIAQLGMWEPIIRGAVEELTNKVDPFFHRLVDPPCVKGDTFNECVFKLENENRVTQDDPYPPCPLYMHHHGEEAAAVALTVQGKPTPAWTVGPFPAGYNEPERGATGLVGFPERSPNAVAVGGPTEADAIAYVKRIEAYAKLWGRDPFNGKPFSR